MCVGVKETGKQEFVGTDEAEIQSFSKKDLHAHNTPSDAWTVVNGKVLDITSFSKRHPGGDLILLAAGKDASVLFQTYHPRGVSPALVDKLTVSIQSVL